MAQFKIYGLRSQLIPARAALSDTIHACAVEALGLPADKRFQRFFALETDDFIYGPDRSERYTIIEISMFAGRTVETKKRLIRLLFEQLEQHCAIAPQDLEITITETPRENWGIRGKVGDELVLNYTVTV